MFTFFVIIGNGDVMVNGKQIHLSAWTQGTTIHLFVIFIYESLALNWVQLAGK